jgi:hypothetical protein
MRTTRKERTRRRYNFRCGYCASSEEEIGAQLTIDHFRPISQSGGNDDDNLVYCCHACNEFKGDYWSDSIQQCLLHPLHDDANEHIVERLDNVLIGLTQRGRLHLAILHLNRPELVIARRRRHRLTLADMLYQQTQERLDTMEAEIRRLSEQIASITGGIPILPKGNEQGEESET